MLNLALTKGRTEKEVLPLLKQIGIDTAPIENKGRKLIFTDGNRLKTILAKGPDVLTYLNAGSADLGIVGSDILTEQQNTQLDMLDLGVSKCHFVLASTSSFDPNAPKRLVIATKYPHITQTYFDSIGTDVAIVKIEGSVELAPLIGMADAIVDIVETGTTLRENHLQVYARLQDVSAHLVVNRLALKQKRSEIYQLITQLQANLK